MSGHRFALQATVPPGDLLTWRGRVLVHGDRAELEFLVAGEVRVVECPGDIPPEQTIAIRWHPNLASVRWPLRREQFRA